MDVWNCRKEKVVIGVEGSGARGLPSSSTDGRGCGPDWVVPVLSLVVLSIWPGEATRPGPAFESAVGDRRWRFMGGGTASSELEGSESGLGDVGERGG